MARPKKSAENAGWANGCSYKFDAESARSHRRPTVGLWPTPRPFLCEAIWTACVFQQIGLSRSDFDHAMSRMGCSLRMGYAAAWAAAEAICRQDDLTTDDPQVSPYAALVAVNAVLFATKRRAR